MKRGMALALAVCVLASLAAGGCTTRSAVLRQAGEGESAPPSAAVFAETIPVLTPEPTPGPTPAPTAEPTPTPCPHLRWENGVCADCGWICAHPGWENGRCAVCGIACDHPSHDGETLLCPVCGERVLHTYEKNVCTRCGETPVFAEETLPRELFNACPRQGTVEKLSYTTEAYTPTWSKEPIPVKKDLYVYLPYGYDPAEKYDVLILLHGNGCTEKYWLLDEQDYLPLSRDAVFTPDLLDQLIDSGHSRPVIVATPTYYRDSSQPDSYVRRMDEPRFVNELREDILPLLVDTYSTWAESGSPEDISARREHFGFAGLSMGSIYAYTAVLPECLDLFGWYGCFSGSDGYIDQIAAALNAEPNRDYPIYYFYNSIGTKDPYYYLHRGQYQELVEWTAGLTEGENAAMTEVKDARHQYNAWSVGLYNFLGVAFSLPEEAESQPPLSDAIQ